MTGVSSEYAKRTLIAAAEAANIRDAEWVAESWVDSIYASLRIDGKEPSVWRHIEAPQLLYAVGSIGIDRETIRGAAAQYINDFTWAEDRNLDWLVANVLAYAELDAFLLSLDATQVFQGASRGGARVVRALWRLFWWCVWLAIVASAFIFVSPWIGAPLVLLTALKIGGNFRSSRRRAALVTSMIDVYTAISSATLSWAVVWDLMERSRRLGAVWDPELYRLVELRK